MAAPAQHAGLCQPAGRLESVKLAAGFGGLYRRYTVPGLALRLAVQVGVQVWVLLRGCRGSSAD